MTVRESAPRVGLHVKTVQSKLRKAGLPCKLGDRITVEQLGTVGLFLEGGVSAPAEHSFTATESGAEMLAIFSREDQGEISQKDLDKLNGLERKVESLKGRNDILERELFQAEQNLGALRNVPAPVLEEEGMAERVFGAEIPLLVGAAVFIGINGYVMGSIAVEILERADAFTWMFYGLTGAAVRFAAMVNAYRLSRSPRLSRFDGNPATPWIAGFFVFELLLHICNFSLAGEGLAWSTWLAILVMSSAISLAGAAFDFVLFTQKISGDANSI